MPRRGGPDRKTPIDSVKHRDKRRNIPTEELRGFVKDDEAAPKEVTFPGLLYARDPSLDPQLVWKGKDDLDRQKLSVPSVPIYIQEKIHPQAVIEDVRAVSQAGKPAQAQLFSDFNGINFEDMIDFYRHESNWANRMILGDSLLVMTSLAEKEGLKGKVQMIYIDPPYGIKFASNWQVSTRKRDVKDGKADDATRQPEQIRAFRDTWELGIHSYLSYWRDRLTVARELLTETGSVFLQINSENVHLLRCILDEVFGSENCVADIVFRKKSLPLGAKLLETMHDHVVFYAKDIEHVKYRPLYQYAEDVTVHWRYASLPDGTTSAISPDEFMSDKHPDGTRYYRLFSLIAPSYSANADFPYDFQSRTYQPPSNGSWVVGNKEKLDRLTATERIQVEGKSISYRLFHDDFPYRKLTNLWHDVAVSYDKIYVVQTTTQAIERCLLMTTDPGDLVLDPTCGSGTTAYVAEEWGRRWITIDTSRVALALARTRLMTAKFPYYLLADSPEGFEKELSLCGTGGLPASDNPSVPSRSSFTADIRRGFVYKRVPHVTLKSIANNEEIDAIHAKWQEKLEPIRAKLNAAVGAYGVRPLEEWQLRRTVDELVSLFPKSSQSASSADKKNLASLLSDWWSLRRERQAEIDSSIARHADTEILYDQPYEDGKRIRVTGPFTVESLSPHRTISFEEKKRLAEVGVDGWLVKKLGAGQFGNIVIENMRKAGVQNTIKNERISFERLEAHPGQWIHAVGEYTDKDRKTRRVAVCIGPEHGTVGPDLVKEAAKEAVQGIGFDILIVAGFAFDPHVSEEAKRYGKLIVLPTRINADLQFGEEYLKKTGSGNLFTVFGEPDITVRRKNGSVTVEIKGLDIYDPTTGQVRSSSTDEIACWFIDTDYNGESFFVRHAYFTGADEPYDKLKRALRAEIDEAAWSDLYSTTSRPFDKPKSGKIAVKVINHYGDEVLKVYEVK